MAFQSAINILKLATIITCILILKFLAYKFQYKYQIFYKIGIYLIFSEYHSSVCLIVN
jgi:hypothetical protein